MAAQVRGCTDVATLPGRRLTPEFLGSVRFDSSDRERLGFALKLTRQRRKTIAIHVHAYDQVEIRAPRHCPRQEIEEFLASKRSWIDRTRGTLAPSAVREWHDGASQLYLGQEHRLCLLRGRPALVAADGQEILIRCTEPGDAEQVRAHLERWYAREAHRRLPERMETLNGRFADGICPTGFRVRKMRARWGSCDATGVICINSLLMRLDWAAVDLVLVHELCHLRHFHHGTAFYALMSRVMPDWKERESRLQSGSAETM